LIVIVAILAAWVIDARQSAAEALAAGESPKVSLGLLYLTLLYVGYRVGRKLLTGKAYPRATGEEPTARNAIPPPAPIIDSAARPTDKPSTAPQTSPDPAHGGGFASAGLPGRTLRLRKIHPLLIVLLVPISIVATVIVMNQRASGDESAQVAPASLVPQSPVASTATTTQLECLSTRRELAIHHRSVEDVTQDTTAAFDENAGASRNAAILFDGASKLRVIQVQVESIGEIHPELRSAHGLLLAGVDRIALAFEKFGADWAGQDSASLGAEADWNSGFDSLKEARRELSDAIC
jgi:hypothetical protein